MVLAVILLAGLLITGCAQKADKPANETAKDQPSKVSESPEKDTPSAKPSKPEVAVNNNAPAGSKKAKMSEEELAEAKKIEGLKEEEMGEPDKKLKPAELKKAKNKLQGCISNVNVIAGALDKYYKEKGKYPEKLDELIPDYLFAPTICPAAGKDTYSASYKYDNNKGTYEFYCKGHNHKEVGLPADYPRFTEQYEEVILPEGFKK